MQWKLAFVFLVQLLDDQADALLGDIGDGWIIISACGLWELDEDALAVAAILLVQLYYRLGNST